MRRLEVESSPFVVAVAVAAGVATEMEGRGIGCTVALALAEQLLDSHRMPLAGLLAVVAAALLVAAWVVAA